jgi:MFS family permease
VPADGSARPGEPTSIWREPAFPRYWTAATISSFGTAVTAVALPVLIVEVLGASPVELGVVNAAQFVPYAVLGVFAGVLVDRWRRKPVLVWASLGRALSLGFVPVLWLLGGLHLWVLACLLVLFGACNVFGFAATQSLLPTVVNRPRLLAANAALDQSDAAAQTAGPALGGLLTGLLGAPIALAVDAVSYVLDAVLIGTLRVVEPIRAAPARRHLRREIGEGLHWAYRHRVLGPLAVSAHLWFVGNAAAVTVLSLVALRGLGLSAVGFGLGLAIAGLAMLLGASLAARAGRRFGQGGVVTLARAGYPIAWTVIALLPTASGAAAPGTVVLLYAALALHGFVGGLENANEMSYRQAVSPDRLLGRVNATMRAANRTAGAVGALAGGALAAAAGTRVALLVAVGLFVSAFLVAALSPVRGARDDDQPVEQ